VFTESTGDSGGRQNIGVIAHGDWALFKGVEFGSTAARQFSARGASGAASGVSGLVEVWLDSRPALPSAVSRWSTRAAGSRGGRSRRTPVR
jgi:hypothetical protein